MKREKSKEGVLKKWRLLAYKAVYALGKGNYLAGCRKLGYGGVIQFLDPNYFFRPGTFEAIVGRLNQHGVRSDLVEAIISEFEQSFDDELAHNQRLNAWFEHARKILIGMSPDGTLKNGARCIGNASYADRLGSTSRQTFGPTAFANLRAAMVLAGANEDAVAQMVNAYEESMSGLIQVGFRRPTEKEILATDYPKSDYCESRHLPALVGVDLANESDSTEVHVDANNGSDPSGALGKLAMLVSRYREQQKLVDQWFWTELRKQQIPPGVSAAILKWLAPDVRSI